VGNVLSIADYKAGGTQTQSFSYDHLDRLVTAQASGGTGGTYSQETYAYSNTNGKIGNLTSKAGVAYTYQDTAHKHAVTHLNGVQKYWYDANGNMTTRKVGSDTYTQTWDYENRLTQVVKNGVTVATFVYDGDGNRVKGTVSGTTTAYVGSHFEWTGSTTTMKKYYDAGGQRVAMRQGSSTVYWLLGDHLGSTAITATSAGAKSAELRYKAWGETRYTSGTTPTSLRYTGQRLEESLGIYQMGARWYDPALGRFLSPDSIVPDFSNPQSLNRFSYTLGNPLCVA
jgi:RHS repeat-associated protein